MLLAIDIGNTHTVVGVLKSGKLLHHWRISSSLARTEDEIGAVLNYLFDKQGYKSDDMKGVCISSVVPDLTSIYALMSKRYMGHKALIIDVNLKLGMNVLYREPGHVGADRLCNAVAGKKKYGVPLIIIDFGTATTFDCLDAAGDYAGGLIAPGIITSINTLHKKAARLPLVELQFPQRIIGKTTDESIQSGILNGSIQMVEGLVREIKTELGSETGVVATGGLAKIMSDRTDCIQAIDPYLSLEGIAMIYDNNRSA